MKKIITTLSVLAALAIPVLAQTPAAPATPVQTTASGCTEEAKTAVYTEFTTHRTTDVTKAYEAAKNISPAPG